MLIEEWSDPEPLVRPLAEVSSAPTVGGLMFGVLHDDGKDGDEHPGQPWPGPSEPPSPDGDTPPGDGTRRK